MGGKEPQLLPYISDEIEISSNKETKPKSKQAKVWFGLFGFMAYQPM